MSSSTIPEADMVVLRANAKHLLALRAMLDSELQGSEDRVAALRYSDMIHRNRGRGKEWRIPRCDHYSGGGGHCGGWACGSCEECGFRMCIECATLSIETGETDHHLRLPPCGGCVHEWWEAALVHKGRHVRELPLACEQVRDGALMAQTQAQCMEEVRLTQEICKARRRADVLERAIQWNRGRGVLLKCQFVRAHGGAAASAHAWQAGVSAWGCGAWAVASVGCMQPGLVNGAPAGGVPACRHCRDTALSEGKTCT